MHRKFIIKQLKSIHILSYIQHCTTSSIDEKEKKRLKGLSEARGITQPHVHAVSLGRHFDAC